jgi:hypothetical protein
MIARQAILWTLVALSVAMASCTSNDAGGEDVAEHRLLASLDDLIDGAWELRVDRAWNGADGNIAVPSDQFTEADYQPVSPGSTYPIEVRDQAARVSVGSAPLNGSRTTETEESVVYDLSEGTFAGGRFVVWADNQGLQAELTIYGSGRPIVKSERGNLVLKR